MGFEFVVLNKSKKENEMKDEQKKNEKIFQKTV
jgi:hypothetical protein